MRDDAMCSGALHEPDGVHLKTKGYVHMWQKANAAAGIEVASADPAADVTATVSAGAAPRKPEKKKTEKKTNKKGERIPLPRPRPQQLIAATAR